MGIYEILLERASNGESFSIDFKKKNLKIGRKYYIKDGEWDNDLSLTEQTELLNNPLEQIEELFQTYKYSVPCEKTEYKKSYFKAKKYDELTDYQMIYNENRLLAQAKLEGYVLMLILSGAFIWTEDMGKWYWQGKDRDLILLKEWFSSSQQ